MASDDVARSAYQFARVRHAGQFRDGSKERYFEHPRRVAKRLVAWGVEDPDIVAAALLHDVLEDGVATPRELDQRFDLAILGLVEQLTKGPGQDYRSIRYMARLVWASPAVWVIKLADRVDNLESLKGSGWSADRIRDYLRKSRLLLEGLLGGAGMVGQENMPVLQRGFEALRECLEDCEKRWGTGTKGGK